MSRKNDPRKSQRQLTKRSPNKVQDHGVSNTSEQGFQTFFTPSPGLTAALLDASLRASVGEVQGFGVLRRRLRAGLSRFVPSDPQSLARINDDIARCLWRYLGSLGQSGQGERQLTSEELIAGLQERLGLSQETFVLLQKLTEEFINWLKYNCRGRFVARWGEIVLSEGKILLKPHQEQPEPLKNTIPTEFICNYIEHSGFTEAEAAENEKKIVAFLRNVPGRSR